ncbi:hypothetical protein JQN59_18225 [Citrobacter sp. B72]|uniref:hypothetical protein n=1 Tax=Citrobacter sp. B72 TaxID=2807631 RepID=UPI001959E305|nr:hypothetical protein [Citrobacter sp. B72]QRQ73095.1 hypothetical protein JQN59_18225 [Citrobacter sp. B72]
MKIGVHDGIHFEPDDEFKTEINPKALAALIKQYKHCCRMTKHCSSVAAYRLCPHELARAKQYQTRRDHLEIFLRLLHTESKEYDIEEIDDHFGGEVDDWSLILKDKVPD